MTKKKTRAPRINLEPGEHSIERVRPKKVDGKYFLHWRIKLHDGRTKAMHTQGATVGETRARALRKAKELLATGSSGTWTLRSPISDYMEANTRPAIQSANLKPTTQKRYDLAYRLLLGDCVDKSSKHKHQYALKGLSIENAMKPRALKNCLEEIAELHGVKNVKHAKLVASKYLAQSLKLDGLIQYNPLADLDLDLSTARQPTVRRGGKSISKEEYKRAIEWLLEQDIGEVKKPKQGRWGLDVRIAERRALIEFILTQATTGMRTSEIGKRKVEDIEIDNNGNIVFVLRADATKTKKARRVPVLNDRIAELLRTRIAELPEGAYLFGSPANPLNEWNERNRNRKLATIYQELAEECNIEIFKVERGHAWRTILNSLLFDELAEDARIRLLGHTREINRSHYTDAREVEALKDKVSRVLFQS